eukprot:gene66714-91358_t
MAEPQERPPRGQEKIWKMTLGTSITKRLNSLILLAAVGGLAGCVTSGSTRLDETGQQLADDSGADARTVQPEKAVFYIQALKGGLVSRIAGLKISSSDRSRALEAEYRALETTPSGQKVVWDGDG